MHKQKTELCHLYSSIFCLFLQYWYAALWCGDDNESLIYRTALLLGWNTIRAPSFFLCLDECVNVTLTEVDMSDVCRYEPLSGLCSYKIRILPPLRVANWIPANTPATRHQFALYPSSYYGYYALLSTSQADAMLCSLLCSGLCSRWSRCSEISEINFIIHQSIITVITDLWLKRVALLVDEHSHPSCTLKAFITFRT